MADTQKKRIYLVDSEDIEEITPDEIRAIVAEVDAQDTETLTE